MESHICRLSDLSGFFHEDVVVLESHVDEFLSLQRRVGAGHRDDLSFLDAKIARSVQSGAKKFKGLELVQLGEDVLKNDPTQKSFKSRLFILLFQFIHFWHLSKQIYG